MPTDRYEAQGDNLMTSNEGVDNVPCMVNAATASRPNPAMKPKIMMVDDEKLNILVVAEYLKSDGYRDLVFTSDPSQVLSLAERERPDAILLDIHMPRLDGFDVLQQIRANPVLAKTPVVILTASTDNEVKARMLELGATDLLRKPVHCGELLARLRNILAATAIQDR